MWGDARVRDLPRVGFGREPLRALLAGMERVALRHGAWGALAQARCLPAGVGQRPHAPTACLPSQDWPCLAWAAWLAGAGQTPGIRLGLGSGQACGPATNVRQRRRASPARCPEPL